MVDNKVDDSAKALELAEENSPKKSKLKSFMTSSSAGNKTFEYYEEEAESAKGVIIPFHRATIIWTRVVAFVVFYFSVRAPIQAAYYDGKAGMFFFMDYFFDILMWVDIYFNFKRRCSRTATW